MPRQYRYICVRDVPEQLHLRVLCIGSGLPLVRLRAHHLEQTTDVWYEVNSIQLGVVCWDKKEAGTSKLTAMTSAWPMLTESPANKLYNRRGLLKIPLSRSSRDILQVLDNIDLLAPTAAPTTAAPTTAAPTTTAPTTAAPTTAAPTTAAPTTGDESLNKQMHKVVGPPIKGMLVTH
ncbi:hypothetical protein CYMTET_2567 [Cymbomonas tetramitiformis]|uniref:Uncharacterized protein n=1 Tax=Cymbomonas tetramitiformis TaxID=36881 RepID=A0AAE0H4Z0_9CHLO|nr:hypothetical protein CYMTET_2567 [Cymbomonas tetramitiformis]